MRGLDHRQGGPLSGRRCGLARRGGARSLHAPPPGVIDSGASQRGPRQRVGRRRGWEYLL
eukprot:scaffold127650_cov24-Phaeocystis_antarctica.AAC.1